MAYQEPLIVPALLQHKQSMIVLHGRGDTAKSFAQGWFGFLSIPLPDGRTIQQHLPHTRFVFPSAKPRQARVWGGTMTQWFDVYTWRSTEYLDWQVEGLRETTEWVHELVRRECELVGAKNVVVGGLSQGCASALIAMLLWEGEPWRGVIGMSGWLPMRHVLNEGMESCGRIENEPAHVAQSQKADEQEEVVEMSTDDKIIIDRYQEAIKTLCGELSISEVMGQVARKIPVFMGHGKLDQTVEIDLGEMARDCLKAMGLEVSWKQYDKLEHWMCGDEMADIAKLFSDESVQSV